MSDSLIRMGIFLPVWVLLIVLVTTLTGIVLHYLLPDKPPEEKKE